MVKVLEEALANNITEELSDKKLIGSIVYNFKTRALKKKSNQPSSWVSTPADQAVMERE